MIQGVEDRANNYASFLILVVDDDEDIRELVTYILVGKGFQVITAIDGSSALTEIEARKPDLILLDAMLPDFSGLEVLKRIRSSQIAGVRQIPVLMLSGMVDQPDFQAHSPFGLTKYLSKPFLPAALLERVSAILAGGSR